MGNGPFSVPPAPELSPEERDELLQFARASIGSAILGGDSSSPVSNTAGIAGPSDGGSFPSEEERVLDSAATVFVSVYHLSDLRGCIGTVRAREPLRETVAEMAVAAATRDPRFAPLGVEELEDLAIEVSVLGPFVPVPAVERDADARFLSIGENGVHLRRGARSGLFLPQVATRFGWDGVEFLEQLVRKAELTSGAWLADDAQLELFRVTSFRGGPAR